MPIPRRNIILASSLLPLAGWAQEEFPNRPIKWVMPFPPGSSDVIARRVGEVAGRTLGQPFAVESRPGAQGAIATRAVSKAPNDGYTLLLGTNSTHAANVYMVKDLGYDPVKDFAPITLLTLNPLALIVNASLPVNSVQEFIKYAKDRPGKLSYGTGNSGSVVAAQLLKTQTGIQALAVNYPGVAQAATDLIGGRIDFMMTDPLNVRGFVDAGKMRMLGVTTRQRLASFPDLVPLAEAGLPDYEYASWVGVFAPSGVPAPVLRRLSDAFVKALADPGVEKFLMGMGMIPGGWPPEQFGSFVLDQIKVWGRLTKDAGLTSL